jgi:hypothetical protein
VKKQDDEAISTYTPVPSATKGTGPGSAGQSGDTQGLPDDAEADSESVEELVEEGQYFEADVVEGVEDADDTDESGEPREVHTRQLREDDVPSEYDNPD